MTFKLTTFDRHAKPVVDNLRKFDLILKLYIELAFIRDFVHIELKFSISWEKAADLYQTSLASSKNYMKSL